MTLFTINAAPRRSIKRTFYHYAARELVSFMHEMRLVLAEDRKAKQPARKPQSRTASRRRRAA